MSDETDVMERAFTAPLLRATKPRYSIEPVFSHQVAGIWEFVRDLVEQACVGPEEFRTHTIDDVLMALTTTENQLWLAVDHREEEPQIAGVLVTIVRTFPRLTAIETSIAGKNWMAWRPLAEEVIGKWGRQIGASHFMGQTSHKALKSLYARRGFAEAATMFVKEIPSHG